MELRFFHGKKGRGKCILLADCICTRRIPAGGGCS